MVANKNIHKKGVFLRIHFWTLVVKIKTMVVPVNEPQEFFYWTVVVRKNETAVVTEPCYFWKTPRLWNWREAPEKTLETKKSNKNWREAPEKKRIQCHAT